MLSEVRLTPAELLTPSQAARVLQVSPQWIVRLVDTGRLEGERTPLGRLVRRESVEQMARERDQSKATKR